MKATQRIVERHAAIAAGGLPRSVEKGKAGFSDEIAIRLGAR